MTFMCTEAPNSSMPMWTGSNMDSTGAAGAMLPGAMWPVMVVFSFRCAPMGARAPGREGRRAPAQNRAGQGELARSGVSGVRSSR